MTLNVPNEIINDTPADALPVNSNYTAIEQYVNTNLINRQGTMAMIGQLTLVGDPVSDNHAVRKGYVDAVLPVGVMLPWLGVAAPAGQWAAANGAALQTSTYQELHNVIGYRYGGSAGTFNLPNMAGVVPVGVKADDPRYGVLGNYGGSTTVPVPSHVHKMDHNHPITDTGNALGSHAHEVRQVTGGSSVDALRSKANSTPGTTDRFMRASATGIDSTEVLATDAQDLTHHHSFDVPAFVGNTVAYSLEVTDPDGLKTTTDFYAPFVVVNYIVRIA